MRFGSLKSALLVAMSFGFGVLSSDSADAAAKDGQVFGDWVARCATAGKTCRVSQTQVGEGGARLFEISFGKIGAKGEFGVVAMVPLGIQIPGGVAIQVDGKQINMPVLQCLPNGCQAGTTLDDAATKLLEKAKSMLIGMLDANGKTVTIAIQTKGLADGLQAIR